ncbi:MAG: hypothetical protein ACFBSD_15840 [Paracoccaceae bacterium]
MHLALRLSAGALVLVAPLAAAQTPEPLAGAEIRTIVSGNTVEGSMLASGRYTEFYAEDGTIRGDGYQAAWSIDGDAMCFDYGEGPDCWQMGRAEDEVVWIQDGEVGGTGRVVEGNPNDF